MTDTDLDTASNYAKTALALLGRTGIPPYPMYFELFYVYATGTNRDLNARMNELLGADGIDRDTATNLCAEYLDIPDVDLRLQTMSKAMSRKISDVNLAINAAMATATTYSGSLEQASTTLTKGLDESGLKLLSARLLDETHRMQDMNRELEKQLERSREDMSSLQDDLDSIRRESLIDTLTRIPNRKGFDERLAIEIDGAQRAGTPLSLIMFDIDRFKAFNDTWGHLTGDQVLRLVGQVLKSNVRGRDLPARFGGEEFVAILPETDLDGAIAVAENIRRSIQAKELLKRSTNEKLGRITLSAGVALLRADDSSASLVERADKSLYLAKESGRNRVVSERGLGDASAVA